MSDNETAAAHTTADLLMPQAVLSQAAQNLAARYAGTPARAIRASAASIGRSTIPPVSHCRRCARSATTSIPGCAACSPS